MPEYLTPGVYVEETSFRAKSIEGVSTSTAGIAGLTAYGPVSYLLPRQPYDAVDRAMVVRRPPMVASYTEFERAFGGLDDVSGDTNYVAHAARAFFANGGRRLYVSRVFPWLKAGGQPDPVQIASQIASRAVTVDGTRAGAIAALWRARWPGQAGRGINVSVNFTRSKNVIVTDWSAAAPAGRITGARPGALVEVGATVAQGQPAPAPPTDVTVPVAAQLRLVARNAATGDLELTDMAGAVAPIAPGLQAYHIQFTVTVTMGQRQDTYSELALSDDHPRSLFKVLAPDDPLDEFALVWLDPFDTANANQVPRTTIAGLCTALLLPGNDGYLTGGSDGAPPVPEDLRGMQASPDDENRPGTGLAALGEIDDIAIVMMPDTVRFGDDDERRTSVQDLLEHCERLRYRIAIVDPGPESTLSEVREFRSKFDSKYGALYYPWVEIIDPVARQEPGAPPPKKLLPPSGFAAGIYARSDIERGVHKAPANEVVLGITKFQKNITFDRQAVLNPEGINALRFFEGRSNRVWGARTMSSDPEWKYVNVRRLFIYLEHSIDKATQWAVFEPNNERLWANMRQSIEDFLLVTWRTGALMGTKPEEAYFVRCDRTTMTQNDLDNGRMICLIGVAPTYPAEFVIFRIGQWTADARQN